MKRALAVSPSRDVDGVELTVMSPGRAMRWRRCSAQALRSRSPAGLKLLA
jgi:hypothetical protein